MNTNLKIAAGLAAVLVVAVVGYNVLPGASPASAVRRRPRRPTASPSPSPIAGSPS